MKIDEFISELERVKEEHGNIEVKKEGGGLKDSTIENVNLLSLRKIREENQPTEKWVRLES